LKDPYERTVAAVLPDGSEIVRYDRAGHYYLEFPPSVETKRRKLSIGAAARLAVESNARVRSSGPYRFPSAIAKARIEIAAEALTVRPEQ
jgi:hypothetical protein